MQLYIHFRICITVLNHKNRVLLQQHNLPNCFNLTVKNIDFHIKSFRGIKCGNEGTQYEYTHTGTNSCKSNGQVKSLRNKRFKGLFNGR